MSKDEGKDEDFAGFVLAMIGMGFLFIGLIALMYAGKDLWIFIAGGFSVLVGLTSVYFAILDAEVKSVREEVKELKKLIKKR